MAKILVIDDCEEFLQMLEGVMEEAGHSYVAVKSVSEAKSFLGAESFDLVLCDLVLPYGDESDSAEHGLAQDSAMTCVYAISELSKSYPKIPVVAMSGALVGEGLDAMNRFGAVRAIAKPFSTTQLIATIEGALSPSVPVESH